MKLIDLLVPEFNKSGGWPKTLDSAVGMKLPCGYWTRELNGTLFFTDKSSNHRIYKGEYEAALAASKQPEYSGEGLPPVGAVIEVNSRHFGWIESKVVAVTRCHLVTEHVGKKGIEASIVHTEIDEHGIATAVSHKSRAFRPARTEAERKRDDAIKQMMACSAVMVEATAGIIYDAIAAGKIPGIRLE